MAKAQSVVDTILGEAGGKTREERYEDMKGVASAIVNRALKEGVSIEAVISGRGQFDAYGKGLPKGSEAYRDLAQQALDDVLRNGPTHKATFFATPSRVGNLPSGLKAETETAGHQYFSDPRDRAITVNREIGGTPPSIGAATAEVDSGLLKSYAPTKSVGSSPFDALFGGFEATPQTFESTTTPSFDTGLLGVEREGYVSPFGPLGDRVTSEFGFRDQPRTPLGVGSANHQGIDLSLQSGEDGYTAQSIGSGVVSFAGPARGYGNMVEVQHDDGTRSRYGHLSEIGNIATGDRIATGTPIGSVGNTGRSKGPHLHLETINQQGVAVDPRSVIDFNPNPTVPTPTFADRVTPGQQISDIANQSVQPSQGLLSNPAVEMASMQDRANEQRAAISANSGIPGQSSFDTGRFVTGDPETAVQGQEALRNAMMPSFDTARFASAEPASGLLTQPSFDPARFGPADDAATTFAQVGMLTQPALPGNIQHSVGLTGVQPTSTLSTAYQPTTAELPNISAPIDMAEEFSRTVPNPGQVRADQIGVQPTSVQTTTPDIGITPPNDIAGPATSEIADAQETQQAQQAAARSTPSRTGLNARNISTAVAGGLLGGAALGPIGGLLGAVLGHQAASGKGLFGGASGGLFSNPNAGLTTNDLGSGAAAAYGAWGGAPGTTGIATDGSRISAMSGGIVSRTDPNGVTSRFGPGDTGPVYGGPGLGGLFGGWGGDDTDTDTDSESGW